MYIRSQLAPMGPEECAQYVNFRLMVAGSMEPLFDDSGLAALCKHSGGICRDVSRLAMLSLLEGARKGVKQVDSETVEACLVPA
jgi:type II secretory pathway predicted ATPase ExeA